MAIASGGTLGNTQNKTAATTVAHTTVTTAIAVGDQIIITLVADNLATVDGQSNNHLSITDNSSPANIYMKQLEWTNTVGGAAGDGVTVSQWKCHARTAIAIGGIITATFSASVTSKNIACWKYTVAAGNTLFCDDIVAAVVDASLNSPSTTVPRTGVSLLASTSYLQVASVGAENTQTSFAWTEDASFTNRATNGTTGGVANTNVKMLHSDRIATLTTDTHQGSSGLSSDWVTILGAYREVPIPKRLNLVGVGGAII